MNQTFIDYDYGLSISISVKTVLATSFAVLEQLWWKGRRRWANTKDPWLNREHVGT